MFVYPVKLIYDESTGTYIASCRDLPLMNSAGDSAEEALMGAIEGLVAAISIEINSRRPVPYGSESLAGEHPVAIPVLVAMKAELHNAMVASGTRQADLARKMGQTPTGIQRLLDVEHSSKVETVERALHLLNRKISVVFTPGLIDEMNGIPFEQLKEEMLNTPGAIKAYEEADR